MDFFEKSFLTYLYHNCIVLSSCCVTAKNKTREQAMRSPAARGGLDQVGQTIYRQHSWCTDERVVWLTGALTPVYIGPVRPRLSLAHQMAARDLPECSGSRRHTSPVGRAQSYDRTDGRQSAPRTGISF